MSVSSTVSNNYDNNNAWLSKEGYGSHHQQTLTNKKVSSAKVNTTATTVESTITIKQQQQQQQQQREAVMHTPNGSRRASKLNHEGFARSTASSRSRAGKEKDDLGMSPQGIFDAFAQAEKQLDNTNKQSHLRRPSTLEVRRKSMAEPSTRRRPSRLDTATTNTTSAATATQQHLQAPPPQRDRAHSLAVVSNIRRTSVAATTQQKKNGTQATSSSPRTPTLQYHHRQKAVKSPMIKKSESPFDGPTSPSTSSAATSVASGLTANCRSLARSSRNNKVTPAAGSGGTSSNSSAADVSPIVTATRQPITMDRQESSLVRLTDVLRDTLAVERQKAKLGLAMQMNHVPTTNQPTSSSAGMERRHMDREMEKEDQNVHGKNNKKTDKHHASVKVDDGNDGDDGDDEQQQQQPKKSMTRSRTKQPAMSAADIIFHAKLRHGKQQEIIGGAVDNNEEKALGGEGEASSSPSTAAAAAGGGGEYPMTPPSSSHLVTLSPPSLVATQTQLDKKQSLLAHVRQQQQQQQHQHQRTNHPDKPSPLQTDLRQQQRQQQQQQQQRAKQSPGSSPDTPTSSTSLRRQPQRPSLSTSRRPSTSSTLKSPCQSPVPQRKKSVHSSVTPNPPSMPARMRKRSMVAGGVNNNNGNGGSGGGSSNNVGDTTATTATATTPLTPTLAASLAHRRRSRTESLKEGLPTSPHSGSTATQRLRKKSIVSQDSSTGTTGSNVASDSTINTSVAATSTTTTTTTTNTANAKKVLTAPPTYTRKRGQTLPGNLAKPPTLQSVTLPPMKVEPIQLPLPKKKATPARGTTTTRNGRSSSQAPQQRSSSSAEGEGESGEEVNLRKRMSKREQRRSSTATTPNGNNNNNTTTTKKKTSPDNSNMISSTRRPSMPHLPSTKPSQRKLSISVASKGGWYSYADTATSANTANNAATTTTTATAFPASPGLAATRTNNTVVRTTKKSNPSPHVPPPIITHRQNSLGNIHQHHHQQQQKQLQQQKQQQEQETASLMTEKGAERTRARSLHEKLAAMVTQHTLQSNHTGTVGNNTGVSSSSGGGGVVSGMLVDDTTMTAFKRDRQTRKSQNYDMDETFQDHRFRTNRRSEPFLFSQQHAYQQHQQQFGSGGGFGVSKSPHTALQLYGPCLSAFEKQEILDFEDVYFVGPYATKIPAVPLPPSPPQQGHNQQQQRPNNHNNYGYDDERGDYIIIRQDHLAYRYEVLEELGRGSFGQVVKCFDHKTNQSVAIKLIRNKRRFHEQALMEVKILKDLVAWDPEDGHHNIRMTDYFYFRNHLCIVCECLSINLYEFIKKYEYKGFAVSLIKRFAVQLLRSLCLLYDHGVIHCDLKPENILLKHPAKSTIKVIDFGSSCFANEKMYTYIQSRFYRAPEIILGTTYDTAIDMWSFGCILAELYTGIPIFPGETEQEQLACIMEILGVPDNYIIDRCSRRKLFFDSNNRPRPVINSRGKQRHPSSKSLASVIRCQEPLFLDFVEKCLKWDPEQRLNPYDALQHGWFTSSSRPASAATATTATTTTATTATATASSTTMAA